MLEKYNKPEDFIPPNTSSECFDEFIKRNNRIDFSFTKDEVKDKLTFYGNSVEFNKIYGQFLDQKDYKADSSIFKEYYGTFILKIKFEEKHQRELEKKN